MKSSSVVKTFLILNLIFCGAVAGFGVKIFQDREMIKARTLLMERAIEEYADNVKYGQQQSWEDAPAGEGSLSLTTPYLAEEVPGYIAILDSMEAVAVTRVEQLATTYETLLIRRQELADTREELRQRTEERDQTREEVARLQGQLAETQGELADARNELNSLKRTNESLTRQVADLDGQIAELDQQISETQEALALRTGERDRIQKLLDACLRPPDQDDPDLAWQGRTATILDIDTAWNFIVLDKGEVDVLPMFLEAEITRDQQRIGKIRVMQVEGKVSLAEILKEELEPDAYPQVGDILTF